MLSLTTSDTTEIIRPNSGYGTEYISINNLGSGWSMIDPIHLQYLADNNFTIIDINYNQNNAGYYILASRRIVEYI